MLPECYRHDLHPDGKRVAAAVAPEQGNVAQDKVVSVFNFGDYLRTIAPGIKEGVPDSWPCET